MNDVVDKIDLKTFISDLEKEEEPKSIDEIYAEVGAFPFTVRKVVDFQALNVTNSPLGHEATVVGLHPSRKNGWYEALPSPDYGTAINARPKLWQLLGHK